MIVDAEPRCHNRPAFTAERPHFAIDPQTGFITGTVIRNDWASPGCRIWDGAGIGQPTEQFPSGTPYPIAHGFDCRGCAHLPEEFKELA